MSQSGVNISSGTLLISLLERQFITSALNPGCNTKLVLDSYLMMDQVQLYQGNRSFSSQSRLAPTRLKKSKTLSLPNSYFC